MPRFVLMTFAILWGIFGALCLVMPEDALFATGLAFTSKDAFSEVRAMYGGAQIGLAVFFFLAARDESLRRPALLMATLLLGGFAIGRAAGILLDASSAAITWVSLTIEVAGFGLAFVALNRTRAATA